MSVTLMPNQICGEGSIPIPALLSWQFGQWKHCYLRNMHHCTIAQKAFYLQTKINACVVKNTLKETSGKPGVN